MAGKRAHANVLVAAILAAAPATLCGQTVRGHLLDATTDRPLAAARVVLLEPGGARVHAVESGPDGAFTLVAPVAGTFDIYAERLGYFAGVATLDLGEGQEVLIQFRLEPSAFPLDSIEVVTTAPRTRLDRAGFHARRQSGIGHLLTFEEFMERGHPRTFTDGLRTLTGVRTEQRRFGPDRILLRRVGTPMDPRPFCEPYLFLDGLPVQPPWEDLIDLNDVAAVEVYPESGRVPASFASRAQGCGVVVVWTRLHYGDPPP